MPVFRELFIMKETKASAPTPAGGFNNPTVRVFSSPSLIRRLSGSFVKPTTEENTQP